MTLTSPRAGNLARTELGWWPALVVALPFVAAFTSQVFFAVGAVLGAEYAGSEQDSSYVVFTIAVGGLTGLVSIGQIFRGRALPISNLLLLAVPAFVLAGFLLDSALSRTEPQSLQYLIYWGAMCVPALYAGTAVASGGGFRYASLVLEPLMWLSTVATGIYAAGNLVGGIRTHGLGGATYQTSAYLAAFAFGLNLYHLLYGDAHRRWRITKWRGYWSLSVGMLLAQAASCLLSGGRGGFLLLVLMAVVIGGGAVLTANAGRVRKLLWIVVVVTIGSMMLLPQVLSGESAARIIARVFAYIGTDGINWEGTSGRDHVYGQALENIGQAPVVGHGLFSWGSGWYPHNIVLEWMLNGGLLYTALWVVVVSCAVWRYISSVRKVEGGKVILPIALYALTVLMFSGTYWTSPGFWFCLAAVLAKRASSPAAVRSDG